MKLFYEKLGSGYPLFILHGLYGSGSNWLSIAKQLADFCEVYLIDQRNHGRSPHAQQHSYFSLMGDIKELADSLDLSKLMLLGHSMGGKAAMYFATHFSGMVSKLIVVDMSPLSYSKEGKEARQIEQHKKIMNALMSLDLNNSKNLKELDQELAKDIQDIRLRQFLFKNLDRKTGKTYRWKLNLEVLLQNLDNMIDGLDFDHIASSGYSQFPALFIRGDQSPYIASDDEAAIKRIFKMSTITTIPNAGHWLHAEQPELFVKIARKFILDY